MTNSSDLRIVAMGDIMLTRDVGDHYFDNKKDFSFEHLDHITKSSDLVLANLENPVGLRGNPHPKQDPHVAFRCHPETLNVINNLNIDVVSLANNHLLDYGAMTLCDTMLHLEEKGIDFVGGGRNYDEANKPLLFDKDGRKVAVLATVMVYSASTERATKNKPGVADYRIGRLLKSIKKLKEQGYIVLVTVHWGIEYSFYPIPYQRKQAMKMIDAGASVILGHGPHYPQGIERYKHGEIVHSLGNFIFDEPYNYAEKSFIYEATINMSGEVVNRRVHPVLLKQHIPYLDEGNKRILAIANRFGDIYKRKTSVFWKKVNSRWFSDIIWRVSFMRSIKFAILPPVSFYFDIGWMNLLKKFSPRNLWWMIRTVAIKVLKRRESTEPRSVYK